MVTDKTTGTYEVVGTEELQKLQRKEKNKAKRARKAWRKLGRKVGVK